MRGGASGGGGGAWAWHTARVCADSATLVRREAAKGKRRGSFDDSDLGGPAARKSLDFSGARRCALGRRRARTRALGGARRRAGRRRWLRGSRGRGGEHDGRAARRRAIFWAC